MGFDAMVMGRGGGVGLYRLEWGQLGLAREGWVGPNYDLLDTGGINYRVPRWT